MQRNVAKDCGIPFSLVPYPGKRWKILSVLVSGVERIGAQKMENCENVYVVRNSVRYPANWLKRIALLLVFSLLAVGVERCLPPALQDPAGETRVERAVPEKTVPVPDADVHPAEGLSDISAGVTVDGGDAAAVPFVSAADGAAETYPSEPAAAAERPAAGMPEMSAPLPVTDIPGNAEEVIPDDTEPDLPVSIPPESPADDNEIVLPGTPSDSGAENGEEVTEEPAGSFNTVGGFLVDEDGMICGIADAGASAAEGVLVLPSEGCTGIRSGAFLDAPAGIVEVYLPGNITVIETGAFLGLDEVEWYEADPQNGAYYTEDGIIFSENGTCILAFPPGRTGIYPVPAQVKVFAADAFAGARIEKLITVGCVLEDTGNLPENIVMM